MLMKCVLKGLNSPDRWSDDAMGCHGETCYRNF